MTLEDPNIRPVRMQLFCEKCPFFFSVEKTIILTIWNPQKQTILTPTPVLNFLSILPSDKK